MTATVAPAPRQGSGSGLPILGPLGPVAHVGGDDAGGDTRRRRE